MGSAGGQEVSGKAKTSSKPQQLVIGSKCQQRKKLNIPAQGIKRNKPKSTMKNNANKMCKGKVRDKCDNFVL